MMTNDLKSKILALYPEYNRITGPTIASDDRARVGFRNTETGEKTIRQLAKVKLEVKIGRRLTNDETVDHIDENKTNDEFDNLQVLSRSENAAKGAIGNKNGLGYKQTAEEKRNGEKNGMSSLTNNEVKNIREAFNSNTVSKQELEVQTNLSRRSVENLLRGVSYAEAGGPLATFKRGRPPAK